MNPDSSKTNTASSTNMKPGSHATFGYSNSYPLPAGCVITVQPWISPRIRRTLSRQSPAMQLKQLRKPVRFPGFSTSSGETKIRRGIVRFARSGWNRVAVSWFARSAATTCPARTTI